MVRETFEKNYTSKDLSGSQKALANFTSKNILSTTTIPPVLYLCKDKNRQKFVFTDKEQIEHEDVNASILIKIVSKGFKHIKKIYKKETEALQKRIDRLMLTDDTPNLLDAREQMKILKSNFENVMNLMENADGYRLQLSKVLPSSLEDQLIIDTKMRELESTDSESEIDEKPESIANSDQPYPLYDKTIRHIGGLSYGSLRRYKDHFLKTGFINVPERFISNEVLVKKFTEFLHNDE
jgi:hypothetical protein